MLSVKQRFLQNRGLGVGRPEAQAPTVRLITIMWRVLSGSQFLICYMKELGSVSVPVLSR